ncbi:MAG: RIP metalloprotease RseP [Cytophagales bacterium]|nr:MAG: RIP metalloprotease RseP [Cytophagales bacterium]TAF61166.1 MAG: RIP metalloprotease RseP [Cytophagales bacterium]
MLLKFTLAITILVGLHELGHMLPAKWFGMRVEKFFIGFPPRLFGFKYGETEYAFGATPLGGFVKISGMIDESLDTESLAKEPEHWEFRAKPAWQRLIVMLGGITMNVILGIFIFTGLTVLQGEYFYKTSEVNINGIYAYENGLKAGFLNGDKIINVNGKTSDNINDLISPANLFEEGAYFTVERAGKELKISIQPELLSSLNQNPKFIEPLITFEVESVEPKTPAFTAGLMAYDQITTVNRYPISSFQDFKIKLLENKGKQIQMGINRNGSPKELTVNVLPDGTIGFMPKLSLQQVHRDYSLAEALVEGPSRAFSVVILNVRAMGRMFTGDINPSESLTGPIGLVKAYGGGWDWVKFWGLTGMISMVLAFMNLLPIPGLDGGHVVFLMYEMVRGKAPSDKFLENTQKVGMVILLALMVFIFGNDIYKLIKDLLA